MKRLLKIVLLGVAVGVPLAALRGRLGMDQRLFWKCYWIAAVVIILGTVLVNVLYSIPYQRKIKQAAALLEAGDADAYTARLEAMLQTAKSRGLRTLLRLNLSAGYCEQRRFDRAVPLLEELAGQRLQGALEVVRRLNLCICYFESGRPEEGLALYYASEARFASWRKKALGGNLAALDITAALAEGRPTEARTLLEQTEAAWSSPRLQEEFRKLRAILEAQEGPAEEGTAAEESGSAKKPGSSAEPGSGERPE